MVFFSHELLSQQPSGPAEQQHDQATAAAAAAATAAAAAGTAGGEALSAASPPAAARGGGGGGGGSGSTLSPVSSLRSQTSTGSLLYPATTVPSASGQTLSLPSLPLSLRQPTARLDESQKGELELARQRAQRAAGAGNVSTQHRDKQARTDPFREADFMPADLSALMPDGDFSDGFEGAFMEEDQGIAPPVSSERSAEATDQQDARKLKRLLRNRASAQQARERKKHYVQALQHQVRDLQQHIRDLEAKLEASDNQTAVLRRLIMSIRAEDKNRDAARGDLVDGMLLDGPLMDGSKVAQGRADAAPGSAGQLEPPSSES